MRTFLFFITSFITISSSAQLLDSIKNSFSYAPVFFIKLDTRNAFVSSYATKLRGIQAGLNFNNTTKIGLGYSWMKSDIQSIYLNDTVDFRMNNVFILLEYTFYRSEKVFADIPIHLGISKLSYSNNDRQVTSTYAFVYEPAMIVELRFLKFFGIGMGAGYRLVLYNHQRINEKLTTPIYIFRFKVYFGDIYQKHLKKQLQ